MENNFPRFLLMRWIRPWNSPHCSGRLKLNRTLEMHTAGKLGSKTLPQSFPPLASLILQLTGLNCYRVCRFSLKQGRGICHCKAASNRQGRVAQRKEIKHRDVRAPPLSALVRMLSLATRRCLCCLQEDFKWLVYRNYFRGIFYMTSSNYIKSVQLLVINLEYICVVIFRGFTKVY